MQEMQEMQETERFHKNAGRLIPTERFRPIFFIISMNPLNIFA